MHTYPCRYITLVISGFSGGATIVARVRRNDEHRIWAFVACTSILMTSP